MKVSVVIITYNHAAYIAQALDSVLMQETDFDYEIILGEDESQDGTREICEEYARQHPDRIRLFLRSRKDVIYIHGKPTGRFNFTENLKAARGEYIALLDGDDYWTDKHKLLKQVALLDTHPDYYLCFHNVTKFIQQTGKYENWDRRWIKSYYTLNDVLRDKVFVQTSSRIFRRGIVSELPDWFYNAPVADWPLLVLCAQRGKIGLIDQSMSVYRVNNGSVWSGENKFRKQQIAITNFTMIQTHLGPRYKKPIKAGISNFYLNEAWLNAELNNYEVAKSYLKKSIKTCFCFRGPLIDQWVMFIRLYFPWLYKGLKAITRTIRTTWTKIVRDQLIQQS